MVEGLTFQISVPRILQVEMASATYVKNLDEAILKRWTMLSACVRQAVATDAQSGGSKDLVKLDINMLKQEGAVLVKDSSSSNEPDDKDDDSDFESPVRCSPRNRTKSKKAVKAAGSDTIKEKLSDKFLAFDVTKHKDWHASVSCLCFCCFLLLIVMTSANCALAAAGAISVPSSNPTVRSSI